VRLVDIGLTSVGSGGYAGDLTPPTIYVGILVPTPLIGLGIYSKGLWLGLELGP